MNFETLASKETIDHTIRALAEKHVEAEFVENKEQALEKIKGYIPQGASVQTGASTTLDQVGFTDYLKSGKHGWNNLKATIVEEKDPDKQSLLRKQALSSEYYLGSVHAVAETGEYVIGSNTGSQMPHVVYSSPNLIFIVSTKKIVPTLTDALRRLEEHVVPQENTRMQKAYGMDTQLSKELIVRNEAAFNKRKIRMLLVNENLGF